MSPTHRIYDKALRVTRVITWPCRMINPFYMSNIIEESYRQREKQRNRRQTETEHNFGDRGGKDK